METTLCSGVGGGEGNERVKASPGIPMFLLRVRKGCSSCLSGMRRSLLLGRGGSAKRAALLLAVPACRPATTYTHTPPAMPDLHGAKAVAVLQMLRCWFEACVPLENVCVCVCARLRMRARACVRAEERVGWVGCTP